MATTNIAKLLPYLEGALRGWGSRACPTPPPEREAHIDDGLLRFVVMDQLRSLQGLLKVVHGWFEVPQLHWREQGRQEDGDRRTVMLCAALRVPGALRSSNTGQPSTTLSRHLLGCLITREQNLGTWALDFRCQESVREGVSAHITHLQGDNSILPHCCPNGPGAGDENEDRTWNQVQWVRGPAASIGLRCRVHSESSFYS